MGALTWVIVIVALIAGVMIFKHIVTNKLHAAANNPAIGAQNQGLLKFGGF